MNLNTINMDREEAERAFIAYDSVAEQTDEDRAIAEGYRQLGKGKKLIRLSETVAAGGVDERGLPRLAVAPTRRPWCYPRLGRDGSVAFTTDTNSWGRPEFGYGSRLRKGAIAFGPNTLPPTEHYVSGRDMRAIVPIVPPQHRVWGWKSSWVLWEAIWEVNPTPPGDPALIRHIGGDLWAVLAMWDLSELERAVLAGR